MARVPAADDSRNFRGRLLDDTENNIRGTRAAGKRKKISAFGNNAG